MNTTASTEITSNAAVLFDGDGSGVADWNDIVAGMVGDYADDFDLAGLRAAVIATAERALHTVRPDWVIAGDFVYGPYPAQHLTETEGEAVREAFDLDGLIEQYDRSQG